MKKNTIVKLVSAVTVILIAAILLVINGTVLAPERHKGSKTVSLRIVYADRTYEYSDLKTDTETVSALLHEYDKVFDLRIESEQSTYGEFILSLKNVRQNEQARAYYTYTVNGQYADAVDKQPIADGDVIEFSFGIATYGDNWEMTGYTLAPSAGLEDKSVSAAYIAIWVCCGVAIAAGIGLAVFALVEWLRDRKAGKEVGRGD